MLFPFHHVKLAIASGADGDLEEVVRLLAKHPGLSWTIGPVSPQNDGDRGALVVHPSLGRVRLGARVRVLR